MASKQDLGATGDVAGLPATSKSKRDKIDPMRIAWLLRADLRRGAPAGDPISDWFKLWWLVNGPREYPAWTDHAALREAGLFRPLPDWPSHGGFGMSPVLRFLLETREDLARTFDVATEQGLWHAIAWLFVHGVREHRLMSALDEQTLAALDAVPPFFAANETSANDTPEVTWLMFFVWRTSSDLQKHFDLRHLHDRHAYLKWFLQDGVLQLELVPLVSPRWRTWLRQPIFESDENAFVPRATYLLWQRYQQLQRAFDLQTAGGLCALAMWSAEVWDTQAELSWIDQPLVPSKVQANSTGERPFGLNLIGFAFGELGIGEDVRMAAAACEAARIPFTVVNIHPGDTLRQKDDALAGHVARGTQHQDPAPYAFNLFCLTAFDTARVFLEKGSALFDEHYNIGWWPWELPVWPKDWLVAFNLVDEVWAATAFTHRMYAKAAALASPNPTPVTLMPMAASVSRVKPVARTEIGLPSDKFLFLYIFDFNSYLARKNPFAVLKAFRKAFAQTDQSVGLVFKTMNSDPSNPQWKRFLKQCAADFRVSIIDRTMERGEVLGLVQVCDAYVSLHRSEGFGRTLAEAMLFGKPVIATDFSGNVDFLNDATGFKVGYHDVVVAPGDYPFITVEDNAWWAEPSVAHASQQLRVAKESWSFPLAAALKQKSRMLFSPLRTGQMMQERLHSAADATVPPTHNPNTI